MTAITPRIVWAGLTECIHNFDEKTSRQQTNGGPMLRQVDIEMDNSMDYRRERVYLYWTEMD
jgi:hypothetical protein